MGRLQPSSHADLLVGANTGDDAAVWRLSDDRALVVTADFITPVVDDARTWGRVAATNAVSDIYAMGGSPLLALNLVGWNTEALSTDLLADVMIGGQDCALADGFVIAGGHTVDDPEPKYGMAVVGEVHPDKMMTNAGLRDGDQLILTKPLGVGVLTTALKRDMADSDSVAAAVAEMCRSNRVASMIAVEAGATGATDVTGFGLMGHLGRMCIESGVTARLTVSAVPLLPRAFELASAGAVPGGSSRNLAWIEPRVDAGETDPVSVALLADAQTSGGLVFGVRPDKVDAVLGQLVDSGHEAACIGHVETQDSADDTIKIHLR